MKDHGLFQLGMDLDAGPAQTEEIMRAVGSDEESAPEEPRKDHFIRRDGAVYAGSHLIIEVAEAQGLDDLARMERAFRRCVAECGATLLHIHLHKFSPQGISGVAVLAESHISVHTWPEAGYAAFDVFMCGEAQPWKAVDILREAFSAGRVIAREIRRGEGLVG